MLKSVTVLLRLRKLESLRTWRAFVTSSDLLLTFISMLMELDTSFNNSLTDTFIAFTRGLPYHKIVNFKSFPSLAIRALEWPLISHVWKAKEIKMTLLLADFWSKQNNPVVIQIPDRMKATAHASLTKVRIQVLNLALEIGSDVHVLPFSNYSHLKKAWWKTKSL